MWLVDCVCVPIVCVCAFARLCDCVKCILIHVSVCVSVCVLSVCGFGLLRDCVFVCLSI